MRDALDAKGAVLIEGAKWYGKTTTAEQIAKSVIYLNNPKLRDQYFMTAQTNPQRLLEGDNPRLIDDWQTAPELWDTIRFDVDHSDADGKYILTGSAVLQEARCLLTMAKINGEKLEPGTYAAGSTVEIGEGALADYLVDTGTDGELIVGGVGLSIVVR